MLPIAAVLVPVLLAFMGLALDVGYLYNLKRRMQTAADAGAMGGAQELWRQNEQSQVIASSLDDAKRNGFDSDDPDITVTVNNPPQNGARAGDINFVEVIITEQTPTYFMRVVNRDAVDVTARAVAELERHADGCVLALNPSERGALTIQGNSTLNAGCGVMVNSQHREALVDNGGGCIVADEIGVTGGTNANATCLSPDAVTEVPPVLDPLAYLGPLAPSLSGTIVGTDTKITGGAVTLSPGRYDGKPAIEITGGTVTFEPGLYVLNSGLKITGGTVIGDGVTFYNTSSNPGNQSSWGDIDIAGNVYADFSAPASGPYEGILFWNDAAAPSTNPGSTIAGTSDSIFEGALYFPSTHLNYVGTSTASRWTMIIADTISVSGNTIVNGGFEDASISPPTRKATLVE